MIKTKPDYLKYLEQDRISRKEKRDKPRLFRDEPWRYQILLRKVEYYTNIKNKNIFATMYLLYLKYKIHKFQLKLGIFIPANVFDSGLHIVHVGGIYINGKAKIGKKCTIYQGVTVGSKSSGGEAPLLGDNISVGAGAVVLGNIKLADGIIIGANSVVTKSFEEPGIIIAGNPAVKVK